jgi:spermidine synthase
MLPWEKLAETTAPDASLVELLRRGREYLIRVAGLDLMSNEDASSASALAELGCAHLTETQASRVLVGGLGMGFTLAAALAHTGPSATVEVAELIEEIVVWNRGPLAELAGRPLDDSRAVVRLGDIGDMLEKTENRYDAILLDVDNGPDSLVHEANERLYAAPLLGAARRALRPGGVLAVWSFTDDVAFTRRLKHAGFQVEVKPVKGSQKGRGRVHYIWLARRSAPSRGAHRRSG